jgi:hypothetical protein
MTSIRPGPPLMTASPISGGYPQVTLATSPRVSTFLPDTETGTRAICAGVWIGWMLCTSTCWFAVLT